MYTHCTGKPPALLRIHQGLPYEYRYAEYEIFLWLLLGGFLKLPALPVVMTAQAFFLWGSIMPLLEPSDRQFAAAISQLAYTNPFLPTRIALEREALGEDFAKEAADWNIRIDSADLPPNIDRLRSRARTIAERCRVKLGDGVRASSREFIEYEAMVLFVLYHEYADRLNQVVQEALRDRSSRSRVAFYGKFVEDLNYYLKAPGVRIPTEHEPAHLFAFFFQLRRAFHHIFSYIIGVSKPTIQLRAQVWQSIFTHDMQRYRRCLYNRMGDITTLITGPSGTGKELVARAVGLSRYIPFDSASRTFAEHFSGSFTTINLSALSPTLIESELFGHKRGAFTGALEDRIGYLEACPPLGTVLLDEIGDIDVSIQVKLLRVLHNRVFQRLGDGESRRFQGKIIAATNRDLPLAIQAGSFREDFYYRLCSDMIVTPSLREQLADSPGELRRLVLFITQRIAGDDEASTLTDEVVTWTEEHLGRDYPWPGNVRELEQCVRNIMVRQSYTPPCSLENSMDWVEAVRDGRLSMDELLGRYCTHVYHKTGSFLETARRLKVDRRTVRRRIEAEKQSRLDK